MRRINLLPPEERRRRGAAVSAPGGLLGILLIVGAVALIFMVGIYLFYLMRLGNEEERIAALDQQIAERNQRIAELSPFRDLQARLEAKRPVVDGIFRTRFPWDEFLQGLAFVIPPSSTLEALTAQAAPVNIQAPVGEPLTPPGAATFTGLALADYENIADFIVRMNTLRFLANTQLNTAELDRDTFAQPALNFETASELITVAGESGETLPLDGETAEEAGTNDEAVVIEPSLAQDQVGIFDPAASSYGP
jgi:type IV pilus assembly protein PilN